MTDLPAARSTATPRPYRHRHVYVPSWVFDPIENREVVFYHRCLHCGREQDEVRSARGKSNARTGKDYERQLAQRLGGRKVGHFGGPEDVTTSLFNVQSKVRKAWPAWMWTELAKLPRTGGRIPVLVVAEGKPLPGTKRRALVVVQLEDWVSLHGEEQG